MSNCFIINLLLTTLLLNYATPLTCPPGTYLYTIIHNGEQFCIECDDGKFIPYKNHLQTSCRPCKKIKEPALEILVSPCNKTHDAVIHCVDGYYRDEARNPRKTGKCKKCKHCEFVGQPCSTYRDTVCCWDENYDVVPNHNGVPVCRERPWFCRQGQYFDTRYYYCLPCPNNTFMNLDIHVEPECWKCREYGTFDSYLPLHSVITQPCNKTHAPVIGCKEGFFMDPNMSYRGDSTGCSRCTDCSTKTDVQYEGRKCDGMEDTVCCPQPNMTVVDTHKGSVCCPHANMTVAETPGGPVCTISSRSCDGGQCTQDNVKGKATTDALPDSSDNIGEGHGHSTTPDVLLNKAISEDDQRSSEIHGASFVLGIAIGIIVIITGKLMYTASIKGHCRRWWRFARERLPWSRPTVARTETKDFGEKDPLQPSHTNMATDHYEHDQCCGDESDLYSKKKSCKNSTGHARFVSLTNLTVESLPEGFHGNDQLAYIKAVGNLTVRLKVNHTSNGRPDNYPCSELRGSLGAGIKRFGTGLVFQVTKKFGEDTNGICPCTYCSVYHIHAKKNWAQFAVVTAAPIVYNDDECKRTSCRLWFDDDSDFVHAPSLKGRYVKEFSSSQDFRILYCVTHDEEVSQKLETMIDDLDTLRQKYQYTLTPNTEERKAAVLFYHCHGLSKKILLSTATGKTDRGVQKWSYDDVQTCPGSIGAPVCLLGKGQEPEFLTTIHSMGNESSGFSF